MPVIPVREIAKYGIITDPDPYDLPAQAWSAGVNARFRNGKITRAPVFRNLGNLSTADPRFIVGVNPTSGGDNLYVSYLTGTVKLFSNGVETDKTKIGWVASAAELPYTSCRLADVLYINRGDRPPWYLRSIDATFQDLSAAGGTSPWPATSFAQILRASNGALCAYNVTKAGVNSPTMVKTSGFPLAGNVPDSWDITVPASNATENILAEMEGGIVDALGLGNLMFIYGQNETWLQQFVGGTFIWQYSKAFSNRGVINANCVIEIEKKHIVFGYDDIWVHDGTSTKSICDQRTREFIFSGLNVTRRNRCFVAHNPDLKELLFCYCSTDRLSQFGQGSVDSANRAAVWNYEDDTWTFDDLPLVFGGTRSNIDTSTTWASAAGTWDAFGGSWADLEGSGKRSTVFVGDTNSTYGITKSVYAFDPTGPLSKVAAAIDIPATGNFYLERDGIDLDELGANLKGYKLLRSIFPEGRFEDGAQPLQFNAGSSDNFDITPTFKGNQSWDANVNYRLDYNTAGRYLSLIISVTDTHFFTLSGLDMDIIVTGHR